MATERIDKLLDAIREQIGKPTNQAVCPHCGRVITLGPAPADGKRPQPARNRARRRVPAATSRTRAARRTAKKIAARPVKAATSKPAVRPELPRLAQEFAKLKFNGRIGDSYRAVRQAIGSTRGMSKDQIRDAKLQWYRKQLGK